MITGRPLFPGSTVEDELHLIFRILGKSCGVMHGKGALITLFCLFIPLVPVVLNSVIKLFTILQHLNPVPTSIQHVTLIATTFSEQHACTQQIQMLNLIM